MNTSLRKISRLLSLVCILATILSSVSPAFAASVSYDQEIKFTHSDASGTFTQVNDFIYIKNGRVAIEETIYPLDATTLEKKRDAQLAELDSWIAKYPFVANFSMVMSPDEAKDLKKKSDEMPKADRDLLTNFLGKLPVRIPTLTDAPIKKVIRVWSLNNPEVSQELEMPDPKTGITGGSIRLGPTGLTWFESQYDAPPHEHVLLKTFLHYWDFTTNQKIKLTDPIPSYKDIRINLEYKSVQIVLDGQKFRWDFAKNKLVKYSTLVKLPAGYNADTAPVFEGSHYIGWYLAKNKSNTQPRMVWFDAVTKKQHILVYPKNVDLKYWSLYGEFAYTASVDPKTNTTKFWQYDFSKKKLSVFFDKVLPDHNLGLQSIEGRQLIFSGPVGDDTEIKHDNPGLAAIVVINADTGVFSRYLVPMRGHLSEGATLDNVIETSDLTVTHNLLGYAQNKLLFLRVDPSFVKYLTPRNSKFGSEKIRPMLERMWAFQLLPRLVRVSNMSSVVAYPVAP